MIEDSTRIVGDAGPGIQDARRRVSFVVSHEDGPTSALGVLRNAQDCEQRLRGLGKTSARIETVGEPEEKGSVSRRARAGEREIRLKNRASAEGRKKAVPAIVASGRSNGGFSIDGDKDTGQRSPTLYSSRTTIKVRLHS